MSYLRLTDYIFVKGVHAKQSVLRFSSVTWGYGTTVHGNRVKRQVSASANLNGKLQFEHTGLWDSLFGLA